MEVEAVVLPSGGHVLRATLLLSPQPAPSPGLVFLPADKTGPDAFVWLTQALAGRGVAVLAVDHRGSGGGDDARDVMSLGQVADVRAALRWLAQQRGVDATRLAVAGHSMGAGLALWVSAEDPLVRASVALAPRVDWFRALAEERVYAPERYAELVGCIAGGRGPDEEPEPYRLRTITRLAGRIQSPTLLVVGALDRMNPPYHVEAMAAALLRAGNPNVESRLIPDCGHWFYNRRAARYEHGAVVDLVAGWLARWLVG